MTPVRRKPGSWHIRQQHYFQAVRISNRRKASNAIQKLILIATKPMAEAPDPPIQAGLLSLPAELRDQIHVCAYDAWHEAQKKCVESRVLWYHLRETKNDMVTLHLVNRQLRKECLYKYYIAARFCFDVSEASTNLMRWAHAIGEEHMDFIETIGLVVRPNAQAPAAALVFWKSVARSTEDKRHLFGRLRPYALSRATCQSIFRRCVLEWKRRVLADVEGADEAFGVVKVIEGHQSHGRSMGDPTELAFDTTSTAATAFFAGKLWKRVCAPCFEVVDTFRLSKEIRI